MYNNNSNSVCLGSGGGGDSQLLEVVHEHLQTHIVCQDGGTAALLWEEVREEGGR